MAGPRDKEPTPREPSRSRYRHVTGPPVARRPRHWSPAPARAESRRPTPPLPARLDLEKTVVFMPPGRRVSRASKGRDAVLVSAPECFRVIALHRAPIDSQSKHAPAARGRRRVKAIENCATPFQ